VPLPTDANHPAARPDDWTFHWPVRVYYEDTDAGGIVYYANFLKFFERCRTEWLRALGVEQRRLAEEHGVQFVVAQLSIDYLRPARLDDALTVRARLARIANSFLVFEQDAVPAADAAAAPLARATVKVACIDRRRGAPARLPDFLADLLRAAQPPRAAGTRP
jgi:acyl-CoA thioester hydrolase